MTLQRALRVNTRVLTGIAFSTLAGTGKLSLPLVVMGFISLIMSAGQEWKWGAGRLKFRLSQAGWNGLLIVACLAVVGDFLWGTRNILQSSLYVLVFLMANKLLTLTRLKDIPQLFVIGFMEFLAAAVLTVDLWYALAFVVYLLTAIWALLLYHVSCETVQKSGNVDVTCLSVTPIPFTTRFFWTTNAIAIAALAVTSSIFLVMPRTGFGFFQKSQGTPIRTSGFSEKVDLGVIGAVKQDPTLVMRVQFPDIEGEPSERVYMRGATFDHYTGQSWINSFSRRRVVAKTEEGVFEVAKKSAHRRGPRVIQEILVEALDISVLFGLPVAAEIRGPFTSVETDAMGGLWLTQPLPGRLQYSVTSIPHYLSTEDREGDLSQYPAEGTSRFLQLPPMGPQVRELAQAMTMATTTPHGMAIAIRDSLLGNYQYTLDVGGHRSDSPLDDFLFTRKTGYCEHYATAMVILLRTLGVPARLVTGYFASEWNNFGHYYAIRQQDAHAWVEVWFPRSGWITFDPTPGTAKESSNPFLKQMGSFIDSFRLKWDRFVIHYNFSDQMTLAKGLKQHSDSVREWVSRGLYSLELRDWTFHEGGSTSLPGAIWLYLMGIFVCGLVGIYALWLRARRARFTPMKRHVHGIRMYERMLKLLTTQGFEKSPNATPYEFSQRIMRECPPAGPMVQALTELYYHTRFGQEPFSPCDLQKVEQLLTHLATVWKPGSQRA